MIKRPLGKTGLMVSVIGFGGLILPRISHEEAVKIIRRALELGINIIDTAKSYGDSEQKIGMAISGKDCIVTTKSLANDKDALLSDIDLSLQRLKLKKIQLYQLHNISSEDRLKRTLMPNGLLDGLKQARSEGKIDFIGFSGHKKDILIEAIKTNEFDFVQMPINVVDRTTWSDVLPLALERNMGIMSMKPLAGGVLTDVSPEITSLALRYVVQQDVSTALVGMRSLYEVEQNARAGYEITPLSQSDLERLYDVADSLSQTFCRQCEYCLPCEQGIDIPTVFILYKHYTRFGARESARERYAKLQVKVDSCIECKQCESKCPYELPITDMLKIAHSTLS